MILQELFELRIVAGDVVLICEQGGVAGDDLGEGGLMRRRLRSCSRSSARSRSLVGELAGKVVWELGDAVFETAEDWD
jgi:hypothetical protein